MQYRRSNTPGGTYFFTVVTHERQTWLDQPWALTTLGDVMRRVREQRPFENLAMVLMPDHLHWLMQLGEGIDLSRCMGSVKSITARQLGIPFWQKGFHDHAVRKEEDLPAVARYVVSNPVRAGLVKRVGEYPHWDAIWL